MRNDVQSHRETDVVGRQGFKQSSAVRELPNLEPDAFGKTAPEMYKDTYGALPAVESRRWTSTIFADGVRQHLVPLVDRKSRTILPGLESFDPASLDFLKELADECDAKIPVDIDPDSGFTRTGIHTGFGKLKCPAGYLQTPMSAKVVDNTNLRESMGLTPGYSEREQRIAVMVWQEIWGHCLPSAVNVPDLSDGGMRRYTHSRQWKLDYALWKCQPRNYARFLSMVERADVYGLANDYEIAYAMNVQKRLQLDEIGRERLANDWLFAMTGGERGDRRPTDKAVNIVWDGVERHYPEFSAMRVRVIDAGPWAINCDLQIVATAHMRAMFKRFPDTFHVNTKEQIQDVVNGKYVYCSDVSEYDQSMSKDAIAVVFSVMRNYYPEGIVRSAERLYQAPYYARPLELGGREGRWSGNPFDWNTSLNSGNRSGHAFTSLVAKVNKVIESLCVIDRIMPVNAQNLRSFLRGEMLMGLVNNGDDEIVWARTPSLIAKFSELRKDVKNGHYVVTPETGQGFSGLLLVRPNPDEPQYVPTQRVHTSIEKMYIPERSIGGRMRPYWVIGWDDRLDALYKSDAGREIWSIHNFLFRKHLEPVLGSTLESILNKARRDLPAHLMGLGDIDREVLADPDKLHYKYGEQDVSADVLNRLTTKIPPAFCEAFLKSHYHGVFV